MKKFNFKNYLNLLPSEQLELIAGYVFLDIENADHYFMTKKEASKYILDTAISIQKISHEDIVNLVESAACLISMSNFRDSISVVEDDMNTRYGINVGCEISSSQVDIEEAAQSSITEIIVRHS